MALNLHLNMDKGGKTVFTTDKAKSETRDIWQQK